MESLNRVLTTISHKEADKIPLCLLLSTYGAKVANMSIKEYFSKPECVANTQIKMMMKYNNDFLFNFYYAAIEVEAFGGYVIYNDNGAPNAGEPIIKDVKEINKLKVPSIKETLCLKKVLETTRLLKEKAGNKAPIIGVVMSPFTLPTIQLGFNRYFDLLYDNEEMFHKLMKINEEFCIEWANAQIEAGATVICYFDPISSTSMITKDMYSKYSFGIAKRCIERIDGPVITHFATGKCIPILDDVLKTGTIAVAVSTFEDIEYIKQKCKGKVSVIGNLNGLEMRNWSKDDVDRKIKELIEQAGPGGGFIISDTHGSIPYLVPEKVLLDISGAVQKHGQYPIKVSKNEE